MQSAKLQSEQKKKNGTPVKSAIKSPNQSQLSSFSHVSSINYSVGLLVLHFGPDWNILKTRLTTQSAVNKIQSFQIKHRPRVQPSGSSSSGSVEEVVDLLSSSLTHDGLQLSGGGVAELLDAGEVLKQGQSFDPANPRDLLDQSQNQWVQQLNWTPPPEGVLPAPPVNLDTIRAG